MSIRRCDAAVISSLELLESRRLLSYGDLDSRFGGGDGFIFEGGGDFDAVRTLQQPSGKLLVVGSVRDTERRDADLFIARYDARGKPDRSFGRRGTGFVTIDFAGESNQAVAAALATNGDIVVLARTGALSTDQQLYSTVWQIPHPDMLVARFKSDGRIDRSFDGDGFKEIGTLDPAHNDIFASGLGVAADGRITLAGWHYAADAPNLPDTTGIIRLTKAGAVDATFNNGKPAIVAGRFEESAFRDDQSLLLGDDYPYGPADYRLVRADGSVDSAFGSTLPFTGGKLFNAGGGNVLRAYGTQIARITAAGQLDTTFGVDGTVDLPAAAYQYDVAARGNGYAVAALQTYPDLISPSYLDVYVLEANGALSTRPRILIDSDVASDPMIVNESAGGIVAGVLRAPDLGDFELHRYTAAGNIDTNFGKAGVIEAPIDSQPVPPGRDFTNLHDGKLLFLDRRPRNSSSNPFDFVLNRYKRDGTFDRSFAGHFNAADDFDTILPLPDGRLYITGASGTLRLRHNLHIDRSFGGGDGHIAARVSAVAPDGKLLSVGRGAQHLILTRYRADGSIDTAFATNGSFNAATLILPGDEVPRELESVTVDGDGRVVAGLVPHIGSVSSTILRLTAGGQLDATFGNAGTLPGPGGGPLEHFGSLTALHNGNVFVLFSDESTFGYMLDESGQQIGPTIGFGLAGPVAELPGNRFALAGQGHPLLTAPNGWVRVYNSDLTLETSFGINGQAAVNLYGRAEAMTDIAVGHDGSLVVRGTTSRQVDGDPPFTRQFIARLQGLAGPHLAGPKFGKDLIGTAVRSNDDLMTPVTNDVF